MFCNSLLYIYVFKVAENVFVEHLLLKVQYLFLKSLFIPITDLILDDDQLKNYTLAEMERLVQSHGKSLKEDYPTMPRSDLSLICEARNKLLYDELNHNQQLLQEEHDRLMSTMTAEQKEVYDTIIARMDADLPGIFFLYGYGGTR